MDKRHVLYAYFRLDANPASNETLAASQKRHPNRAPRLPRQSATHLLVLASLYSPTFFAFQNALFYASSPVCEFHAAVRVVSALAAAAAGYAAAAVCFAENAYPCRVHAFLCAVSVLAGTHAAFSMAGSGSAVFMGCILFGMAATLRYAVAGAGGKCIKFPVFAAVVMCGALVFHIAAIGARLDVVPPVDGGSVPCETRVAIAGLVATAALHGASLAPYFVAFRPETWTALDLLCAAAFAVPASLQLAAPQLVWVPFTVPNALLGLHIGGVSAGESAVLVLQLGVTVTGVLAKLWTLFHATDTDPAADTETWFTWLLFALLAAGCMLNLGPGGLGALYLAAALSLALFALDSASGLVSAAWAYLCQPWGATTARGSPSY